uniref:DNA mismatch repair protein MutL n=2 Tax=Candidatus Bipolaricaulota TaxID=67810 RepID=H5S8Y3_9BACT|nr:DNA mismatch repair protein MutL [uncultured Acetothermia bacterium]BAL52619.1 DNA mismatch repair protein MutL [uncultured Acetothermia bacterium]BAL59622.1 DNA mismatch repair protein MutL [Candidatus Acetothermum autotrophicum]
MKVKVLDAHLVNKIAAGEVIERPASVAKELIENALDAGATKIELSVGGGGEHRLCVADDGEGMTQDDLLLAVQRHTTSKISSEEDLFHIRTLGFRGEALASIVEVSKTVITSKSDDSPEGVRVELEGGRVISVKAAGRARGTTVDVRELFFNVPARRKFLKSQKTEFFHIVRVVKRFALAYPTVHFRLEHDGKTILDLPPTSELRQTIAQLYTAELARALLDVHTAIPGITVRGLVSPAQLTRPDRSEQFLFVNGRFVKDTQINYAISQAYESVLKGDQHPYIFLFIEIDPRAVDVNVHPQKAEVRFAEPIKVQAVVKQAITKALTSAHAVPRLEKTDLTREPPSRLRGGAGGEVIEPDEKLDLRKEFTEVRQQPLVSPSVAPEPVPSFRVLGQLHGTYIIVQTESGLEIIDQHVAHERILYERFLAQLKEQRVLRQRLLIPITIEMPPDKAELLAAHLRDLDERLGIGIEHFGGGTFIVRDWPQVLTSDWSKADFTETVERVLAVLEHEAEPALEELAKTLAARVACEAAVVKNKPLRPEEMTELIRQLKQTQNPHRCPHGRPIVLAYSLEELEKRFGRR